MTFKAFGVVVLAILAATGAGWVWGASGRAGVLLERRTFEERATIAEARAALLDARLSLLASNFGDAAKQLETGRSVLADLQTKLREIGMAERAGHVEIVLTHLRDAQRLTAALDRDAEKAAAEAADALQKLTPVTSRQSP